MADIDYTAKAAQATALIKRYGIERHLRVPTHSGTAYNPTEAPVDHPIQLALVGYKEKQIDGVNVLATDKLGWMAVEGLPVINEDEMLKNKIVINSKELSIVTAKAIKPADTVVAWKLQLRW